jgi:hypothetical protein
VNAISTGTREDVVRALAARAGENDIVAAASADGVEAAQAAD